MKNRPEESISRSVTDHLTRHSADRRLTHERLGHGPILDHIPDFRIAKLKLRASGIPGETWVYCTVGAFLVDFEEHIKHEFFILSPFECFAHVETLTMLANYHADAQHRLKIGDVVNIGSAWIPEASCDHLLISLPYPLGPDFEWLKLEGTCVRFLWALPITAREAAFTDVHGYEELEKRFDAARINFLDPNRESVL